MMYAPYTHDSLRGYARLRFFAGLLFALGLLFFSLHAQADTDTGILDDIAKSYKSATGGWATVLLGYANRLFMLLATIELAWSAAIWVLDKSEFQSLVSAMAKKIMWLGMFYALLLNGHTWVPFIIDSFSQAGAAASNNTTGLSPSEVFSTGLDNAAAMLSGALQMGFFEAIGAIVIVGFAAILVVLCFAIIAAQLLVALVESYIVISAGLIFLGFGGSRWTNDFVQKYISYAVGAGVKLLMLYLVIGIGNAQAQGWKALLIADESFFHSVFTVLGGAMMLTFLAVQIPSLAASMLAGSPTLTGGAGISTNTMLAAGVVGLGAKTATMTRSGLNAAANADKKMPSGGMPGASFGSTQAQATRAGAGAGAGTGTSPDANATAGYGNAAGAGIDSPSISAAVPPSAGGAAGGFASAAPPPPMSSQSSRFGRFLHNLRYARPPHVHDGAMPATVHIKLDPPQD